jgi:hypothetical protein
MIPIFSIIKKNKKNMGPGPLLKKNKKYKKIDAMSRRFMRFAYMPKKEFFIRPWDKYKKNKKVGVLF